MGETTTLPLTFEEALGLIKIGGGGMRLPHWSEEAFVRCQMPDEHSKMTSPYLYLENRFGKVPWKETYPEMFSDNWEVTNGRPEWSVDMKREAMLNGKW